MTDYISRADAIEAVASITMSIHLSDVICDKLLALPSAELTLQTPQTYGKSINPSNAEVVSADAEPIVIRSKTLLPTKDFKAWAKRIKEENPNAIVIPCDAEVVSAVPQLKQTDTLIIADALRYLINDEERHELDRTRAEELREQILQYGASMCSSADAVQGWIPCSERLPSEDGSYLVTSSFGKVYTAHFYSEHGRWQYNRRGLIEAWMPLPKPYRERREK